MPVMKSPSEVVQLTWWVPSAHLPAVPEGLPKDTCLKQHSGKYWTGQLGTFAGHPQHRHISLQRMTGNWVVWKLLCGRGSGMTGFAVVFACPGGILCPTTSKLPVDDAQLGDLDGTELATLCGSEGASEGA